MLAYLAPKIRWCPIYWAIFHQDFIRRETSEPSSPQRRSCSLSCSFISFKPFWTIISNKIALDLMLSYSTNRKQRVRILRVLKCLESYKRRCSTTIDICSNVYDATICECNSTIDLVIDKLEKHSFKMASWSSKDAMKLNEGRFYAVW